MLLNFDYDGVFVDSLDDLLDKTCQAQKIIGYGRTPEKKDFQTIKDLTFEQVAHTIGIPDDKLYDFGLKLFEEVQLFLFDLALSPSPMGSCL